MDMHVRASGAREFRPLAAGIAALLGFASPLAHATNRSVTSCLDDATPGTLRNVIANVTTVSGDVVDLSALSCPGSVITLATGGSCIAIGQNSLSIKGPGAASLTIDGTQLQGGYPNYSNVFCHSGGGALTIEKLTALGGHVAHHFTTGLGGCIYSNGSVTVKDSVIKQCSAFSISYAARGGAIYAKGSVDLMASAVFGNSATGVSGDGGGITALGDVTLTSSSVTGNTVSGANGVSGGGIFAGGKLTLGFSIVSNNGTGSSNLASYGGGAFATGDLSVSYTQIAGNHASGNAFYAASGGGLYAHSNATIANSTISGNSASSGAGVKAFNQAPAGLTFMMRNSTVSSNDASGSTGGVVVNAGTVGIYNSTIAFNTSNNGAASAGLVLNAVKAPVTATLQSTIISNNSYAGSDVDIGVVNPPGVTFNAGPANNLIRTAPITGLPNDTIFGTCPYLGPLRDNGGLTLTHALTGKSMAIDHGNNVLINPNTMQPYANDQRGSAIVNGVLDYLRVYGTQADIGAYEVQADIVFGFGFDGCTPVEA